MPGKSVEAPAMVGSGASSSSVKSLPEQIETDCHYKSSKVVRNIPNQRSFSNDLSREEAWVRRKDLFSVEESHDQHKGRTVGRSASDCGDRNWPVRGFKSQARARSLTDEDLEELRGCIDLGFRFSYDEDHNLCNTFPALDLYYAINRQYNDCKSKASPVSTSNCSIQQSDSCGGSPSSPLCETWKISSPGDNSQEVKTRLRHWAQAVACSVRQSC